MTLRVRCSSASQRSSVPAISTSILLDPGDVLVVYNDGLTQAQPDLLIDRSLLAGLIDDTNSAAGIADRLIELGRAAGPLTDDVTIAVLRRSATR